MMRPMSPFTVSQWQELEHQASIFKYLMVGLPVPPDLVLPIQKGFESMSARLFHHPTNLDLFGIVYIEAGMGTEISHEIEENSIKIPDLDERRVSSIKKMLPSKSPLSGQNCIFRVPITVLGGCKPYVYEPRLVSIGPFHHGRQPNLKEMEGVKLWYLQCLLDRLPTTETSLAHFLKAIGEMETYCRQCYAGEINLGSDQFIEMMVLDGCFIIELFRRFEFKKRPGRSVSDDDPVFDVIWKLSPLAHDLALLENQLPWKVLVCLWNLTASPEERCEDSLHYHALHFFREVLVLPKQYTSYGMHRQRRHLLDVLRNILLRRDYVNCGETNKVYSIPCATYLWQVGVKFKKVEPSDFPFIGFDKGKMYIPPIVVHENAEILFKNVIAFEQCDPGCSINIISSYAAVLCDLFHSTKDVDLLTRKGIVMSFLNPEDTLGFFKSLSNGVVINSTHFYGDVYDRVDKFLKEPSLLSKMQRGWNRYGAMLNRDYFNSPWSIIKVIAATLMLGFALVKTLIAIFTYWDLSDPNRLNP